MGDSTASFCCPKERQISTRLVALATRDQVEELSFRILVNRQLRLLRIYGKWLANFVIFIPTLWDKMQASEPP
jgi:hypothetical protein